MPTISWKVQLATSMHTVALECAEWSGGWAVTVDGERVSYKQSEERRQVTFEFRADGHNCAAVVAPKWDRSCCSLTVEGSEVIGDACVHEDSYHLSWYGSSPLGARLGSRTTYFLFVGVLSIVVGLLISVLAPPRIPSLADLQDVTGRIRDVSVQRDRGVSRTQVILEDPPVRLRYSSDDDAFYRAIETRLRKGDTITVWVARDDYTRGGRLRTWRTKHEEGLLVSFEEQSELQELHGAFWREVGVAIVLTGSCLLLLAPRRLRREEVASNDLSDLRDVLLPALARVLAVAVLLAVAWLLSYQAYRAVVLGATGFVTWVLVAKALLLCLAGEAAMKVNIRNRRKYWASYVITVPALSMLFLEPTYYVPSALLIQKLGHPLAEITPPLLLLFSGPSICLLLRPVVLSLALTRGARRAIALAFCSVSIVSAGVVNVVWAPLSGGMSQWPLVGTALVGLFGYLFLTELPKTKLGRSDRTAAVRRHR